MASFIDLALENINFKVLTKPITVKIQLCEEHMLFVVSALSHNFMI